MLLRERDAVYCKNYTEHTLWGQTVQGSYIEACGTYRAAGIYRVNLTSAKSNIGLMLLRNLAEHGRYWLHSCQLLKEGCAAQLFSQLVY
jgi:hypothetical protein